jgi:hypothetical protein
LFLAVAFIVHTVRDVGGIIGKSLDELHEKVDAIQEKLEEIEAEQGGTKYINPIDI